MKRNVNGYKPEKATFKEYIGIFKGIRLPWLFLGLMVVAALCTTLASLSAAYFTGDMVDAQGNVPTTELVTYVLAMLAISVCVTANTIFSAISSERINLGLRKKLWSKIIYTKQSCYDVDGGESLVSRITTDCDFASRLLIIIVDIVGLAISLYMYITEMYSLNLTLSNYMLLLLIPLSALIGWGYSKLRYLVAQKNQAMLAKTTTYLVERTGDLSLIKSANAQSSEIVRGDECFKEQYVMQIKTGLMNAFYVSLQSVFDLVSIVIPFALGAALVASGKLSAGDVVVFYGIAGTVGITFTNVIDYAGMIRQANGALARVINAMKLPDEQNDAGKTMDTPDEDIVFENVEFAYEQDAVLRNVTCRIPKHKVTAVVGANGSGKSTMFKLMERLYEPTGGEIRFGDENVQAFNLQAWRRAIGSVAQGSPLMEGTLRENICYGCQRKVSDEELENVARLARVADFAESLPDRYDTMLTAGGQNLSGGQRQCVAIARAMMSSPDYLLLDEATSSLDAKNEHAVMEALGELMKDRTTVIIAHSLSAIRNADYVIVLRDGHVETAGSPKQVMEQSGNYLTKVMNRKRPEMA